MSTTTAAPLTLTVPRQVKPAEPVNLVFGTGALSFGSWWHRADLIRDGKVVREILDHEVEPTDVIRIRHDSADGPEGDAAGLTDLTLQAIVDAAGRALAGDGVRLDDESAREMAAEDLGLGDAIAADIVLQLAVYGELIFG